MLDFHELEQLVAFADLGTLSKVSEQFHISSPSITRSMQHLEECFGVSLFSRSKNRIELNETGRKAVECARSILDEVNHAIHEVREFDQRQKTIMVKSCAPAPLWQLLPTLSSRFPDMTTSSHICQNDEVLMDLESEKCDVAILSFEYQPMPDSPYQVSEFMKEQLYICVKKEHKLAKHAQVSFSDINGFNFLLRSQLGFWDALCRAKMPASKFLVQENDFEFQELVSSSSLPCFTTDITLHNQSIYHDRMCIPIIDSEATATFFLVTRHNFLSI